MAKREIVQYILENSKRGFSSQRIRQSLLAQGWSDYDIEEGFRYIRDGNQRLPEKNTVFTTGSFFESGFFKLILGVLILIAFVVLILLILPERESFSISDFSNNTSLEISKENAKIKLGEEGKVMKLSKSGNRIDYSFNGSEGVLLVGEELNFDLEGDGEYDFFMRYESVNEENFPILFFGEYVPCVPNWNCGNWGDCINGIQIRSCIDENSCGSLEGRPVVKKICVVEEEKVIVENETELNETEVNESVGNQTGINETATNQTEVNETIILLCEGFVNRTEIGGVNLSAGTVYGFSEVDLEGIFVSNMSGEGAQLGMVLEGEDLRATTISLASCDEPWIFDANSTAKAQIFLSLGFFSNTEVDSAREELESISQLDSFGNFSSYLRNNLHNSSLSSLGENSDYIHYLNASVVEMSCLLDLDYFPCD
jgi:hypothetical protein